MTSQAQLKFIENTHLGLVFSIQNLTRLVKSFLWLQNSRDPAVSKNNMQCCQTITPIFEVATQKETSSLGAI